MGQVVDVVGWMVYWYRALLPRPPMRRSCAGCRKAEATGRRSSLGRRRLITPWRGLAHIASAFFALAQRLEGNKNRCRRCPAAGKGVDMGHGRIGPDDVDQRLTEKFMKGKEASCGPCTPPGSTPVSCCGKKPLGILIDHHAIQRDGEAKHDQHQSRIVEHPQQRMPVNRRSCP